jgi:hypothetical protein
MKTIILTIPFVMLSHAHAHAVEFPSSGPCITTHLNEAIEINRERRAPYSSLSNGRSEEITSGLIRMEILMLPLSYVFDRLARKYQRAGIPVFCQDMIPMDQTPDFMPQFPNGNPDLSTYYAPSAQIIKRDLKAGLEQNGFSGIEGQAIKWYNVLAAEPRFNCLTRHFLESTVRSARLAKKYDAKASAQKTQSPHRLMLRYLKSSLSAFGIAISLDKKAAPLQANGLPILCRDVPHIPFDSDWMP